MFDPDYSRRRKFNPIDSVEYSFQCSSCRSLIILPLPNIFSVEAQCIDRLTESYRPVQFNSNQENALHLYTTLFVSLVSVYSGTVLSEIDFHARVPGSVVDAVTQLLI